MLLSVIVNISQLLTSTNLIRKTMQENLLQGQPVLKSSIDFGNFFSKLEQSSLEIYKALVSQDENGNSLAQNLARVLDIDNERRQISEDHLFHSLHNFGISKNFDGLELDHTNAQEVLGSLFETLDTLIRVQDDQNSHIGEYDQLVNLNLERLSSLIENFDSMISEILVKVSDATFSTLKKTIFHQNPILSTNLEANFEVARVDRKTII